MTFTPTGRQFHLVAGDYAADVVEVAAGLRTLTHRSRPLIAGYSAEETPLAGRGITLVPWPGRIGAGRYEWDGTVHQLALSEPGLGNASHGLLRYVPWQLVEASETVVELSQRIMPQRGYPFAVECSMRYELDASEGLTVTASARNIGVDAAPFGFGSHPYLSVGTATVDDCQARVPARTAYVLDDRLLPVDAVPAAELNLDFRAERLIGEQRINGALTDLDRDADGLAWSWLRGPDGDASYLWCDEAFGYVVVYTMDIDGPQARTGFAVEPQTCPPNAFATGTGVIRLDAGGTWTGRYGFRMDHPAIEASQ